MAKYNVVQSAGRYRFYWPDLGLGCEVDRIKTENGGRAVCRLKVTADIPGISPQLYYGQFNLTSIRSRNELAKILEARCPVKGVDQLWDKLLEDMCREVLEREEAGEPAVRLNLVEPEEVSFLVRPIVLDHGPTLWYGFGGSGKSYLAMLVALLVQNGLGYLGETRKANTLYLDWETDEETAERRASALALPLSEHFGAKLELPLYRRCVLPLADDIAEVAQIVADNRVGFTVIDSAGPACGGDLYATQPTLAFFSSIRKLCAENDGAALVVTHIAKGERKTPGRRTPFGCAYFEYQPRAVWEVRPDEYGEDYVVVGFHLTKANDLPNMPPVGIKLSFIDRYVVATPSTVGDIKDERATQRELVLEYLASGAKSLSDIAAYLETSKVVAAQLLKNMLARNQVVKLKRGVWGLPEKTGLEVGR